MSSKEFVVALPAEVCTDEWLGHLRHILSEFPGAIPVMGIFVGPEVTCLLDLEVGVSESPFLPRLVGDQLGVVSRYYRGEAQS